MKVSANPMRTTGTRAVSASLSVRSWITPPLSAAALTCRCKRHSRSNQAIAAPAAATSTTVRRSQAACVEEMACAPRIAAPKTMLASAIKHVLTTGHVRQTLISNPTQRARVERPTPRASDRGDHAKPDPLAPAVVMLIAPVKVKCEHEQEHTECEIEEDSGEVAVTGR